MNSGFQKSAALRFGASQRELLTIRNWVTIGLLALAAFSAVAAGLPDTGLDKCSNGTALVACSEAVAGDSGTYPGTDGRYGRDAAAAAGVLAKAGGGDAGFDYTALDAAGLSTAPGAGASSHPCVRDNITGLVWEVKTTSGLHNGNWKYTWYNSNTSTNGGNAGTNTETTTCGGTLASCNTEAFVQAVNAAGWCGFYDWRMPTNLELESIVHLGEQAPAIDLVFFPNTFIVAGTWSGATVASLPTKAWLFNFSIGPLYWGTKTETNLVRLVRGGPL